MRVSVALGIALATLSVSFPANGQEEAGSIRYAFRTLLVPDELGERSLVIGKRDAWFTGKGVPVRAVVLNDAVALSEINQVLPKGIVLSVSDSAYFVACQDKVLMSVNGGMGRLPICLIDMDRDGVLDAWYRSSVPLTWNHYAGHIQRDDIHPIEPVATTELSPDELRKVEPWGYFRARYERGMLTFCLGASDICLTEAPRIKPSDVEQTVEFMGGLYSYRKLEDGKLAIEIRRDPIGMLY